jgi:hypothetical protein
MATMAKPRALGPLHAHFKDLPLTDFASSILRPKFGGSHLPSQLNVTLKHTRNASIVPIIRAQSSPGVSDALCHLFWGNIVMGVG